jgi:GAF domain-containing protein
MAEENEGRPCVDLPQGPDLITRNHPMTDSGRSPREAERAQQLRGLLAAQRGLADELSSLSVLHRIVRVACDLVGAKYGALGVLGPDGLFQQFVHHGLTPAQARLIGALPRGHGLLGAVLEAEGVVRLDNATTDPRAAGFPPRHPRMASFLGVPIRVRGEVFGELYLADPVPGQFDADDEDVITSLATTAGTAIETARLYDEAQRSREWLYVAAEQVGTLAERDRVVRELHDSVIQRLFATGVGLQALLTQVPDRQLAARLARHIADLDDTIAEIRTRIPGADDPLDGPQLRQTAVPGTAPTRDVVC